jgi:hypothetical protein
MPPLPAGTPTWPASAGCASARRCVALPPAQDAFLAQLLATRTPLVVAVASGGAVDVAPALGLNVPAGQGLHAAAPEAAKAPAGQGVAAAGHESAASA